MKKIPIKLVFLVFTIVVFVFSITSLFIGFGNIKYLSSNYITTQGTITFVQQARQRVGPTRKNTNSIYLTIEFKTLNSEAVVFTALQQVRIFVFPQRGQKIPVVYNKNNPQEAAIKLANDQWIFLSIPFFILIILFILYRKRALFLGAHTN